MSCRGPERSRGVALAIIAGPVAGKDHRDVVGRGPARLPSDLGERDLAAVAMLDGAGFAVCRLIAGLPARGGVVAAREQARSAG